MSSSSNDNYAGAHLLFGELSRNSVTNAVAPPRRVREVQPVLSSSGKREAQTVAKDVDGLSKSALEPPQRLQLKSGIIGTGRLSNDRTAINRPPQSYDHLHLTSPHLAELVKDPLSRNDNSDGPRVTAFVGDDSSEVSEQLFADRMGVDEEQGREATTLDQAGEDGWRTDFEWAIPNGQAELQDPAFPDGFRDSQTLGAQFDLPAPAGKEKVEAEQVMLPYVYQEPFVLWEADDVDFFDASNDPNVSRGIGVITPMHGAPQKLLSSLIEPATPGLEIIPQRSDTVAEDGNSIAFPPLPELSGSDYDFFTRPSSRCQYEVVPPEVAAGKAVKPLQDDCAPILQSQSHIPTVQFQLQGPPPELSDHDQRLLVGYRELIEQRKEQFRQERAAERAAWRRRELTTKSEERMEMLAGLREQDR